MRVSLCEATQSDWELMLAWRSNPDLYQGFYTQDKPLTWDEHIKWIESRNKDWRTFIILYEGRRVGIVTVANLDHWAPEVGFYVGEKNLWGKGIGKEAVGLGLEYIKSYDRDYARTTILNNNYRSIRLIKSLGFEYLGPAREGESWWQKKL